MLVPDFATNSNPLIFWSIAAVSTFCIGFSKSGVAGAAILSVPLMAMIFPAMESTGILLPMLVAGDFIAVYSYRSHARWKHIIRALPWAFVGIVLGWAAMKYSGISQDGFKKFIGVVVILVILFGEWLNRRGSPENMRIPHSHLFAAAIGILGGFTTMTANAAGPVFAIYLLALELPKNNFIGTNAWIFMILNLSKLPFSVQLGFITVESLFFNIGMLPIIALGSFVGYRMARRLPEKTFSALVRILAAIASIKLLF